MLKKMHPYKEGSLAFGVKENKDHEKGKACGCLFLWRLSSPHWPHWTRMEPHTSQNNSFTFFSQVSLLHRFKTIFMRWVTEIQLSSLLWGTTIWLVFKEIQYLSLWKRSSKKSLFSLPEAFFPWEGMEGIRLSRRPRQGKGDKLTLSGEAPSPKALSLTSLPAFPCLHPCSSCITPHSRPLPLCSLPAPSQPASWERVLDIPHLVSAYTEQSQTLKPWRLAQEELTQVSTYLTFFNHVFHSSKPQAVVGGKKWDTIHITRNLLRSQLNGLIERMSKSLTQKLNPLSG